jgi:uncharacterized protein (DUF58 family)
MTSGQARWRPTWALRRVVFLTAVLTGAALVTGESTLALLVIPMAVGTALAWSDRPSSVPELHVESPRLTEQLAGSSVRMEVTGAPGVQLATVRAPFHVQHTAGRLVCVNPGETGRSLTFPVNTEVWGLADFGTTALVAAGPDGLMVAGPTAHLIGSCRVLPTAHDIPAAELPARTAGQVGAHRTHRPGDGSELLDIREFRTGDRLRRIDWRVSARRDQIYVRRTAIDADAELVICIDPRIDVGPDLTGWATGVVTEPEGNSGVSTPVGSLDASVRIAASLAATYLRQGDRVGLVNLAMPEWGVPLGAGHRQLARIRWQLTGLVGGVTTAGLTVRDGAVPPGAVVMVLSPLLDDTATSMVARLATTHRDVIALDVLPQPIVLPTDRAMKAAARLVLAERDHRIRMLGRHGVIVTRWEPNMVRRLLRQRTSRDPAQRGQHAWRIS